ncbi:MAG: sensor histidine kinase [Streptosporangiales bacterium]|nr:sensor histidine kinase [Streptosporangiales bacterium]
MTASEPPVEDGARSGQAEPGRLPPWLRAPLTWTPWKYTIHVLLGLILGVLYFALVPPFTALALVTTPFLFLGTPLLWLSMGLARAFANLDRARLRGFAGVDVPPSPLEGRTGVVRSLSTLLRSRDRWREIGYCLARLPVSAVQAGLVGGSWGFGITLLTGAPFVLFDSGSWAVAQTSLMLAGGVALLVTAPWLARAAIIVDAVVVRSLLGPSEKERLTEEVSTLRTSRAGVVAAADAERRRIERDLHDGAQQRLVALAMDLGVARARYADDPDEVRVLIVKAHEESKAALADLRELVRGIHPAVLTDRGLDAALSALAARCAVPVAVDVDVAERADLTVEAAAYFVVAEALTNVSRHSGATQAKIAVVRIDDRLRVSIEDDGRGGATMAAGTGLAGLERRVAALDGVFEVHSPYGGPTTIIAELPCASY